jgi:NAD dependent epimerase/dehydratase
VPDEVDHVNLKGKNVLVTGADGFIGSHLTERLVLQGARVRVFCLYNSQGSLGWLETVAPEIRTELDVQFGDIRDSCLVDQACRNIDVVFHLAALIAIPYSYIAAESFVDTNVRGTLNVLEAARHCGVQRVVHTSTSEVYGTPASVPIRETHPLNAQSPYAATKIAADQLTLAYFQSFNTPVAVLRPFNTFGPRQSTRAVTATILVQLLAGKEKISLGRLDTRRDLTYIGDVVEGFIRAGSVEGIEGKVIQLGTGRSVSIEELFNLICRVLGVRAAVVEDIRRLRPDASEVLELRSDPSLALRLLGWKATVTLEEGLERTASWLKENRQNYRPDFLYV